MPAGHPKPASRPSPHQPTPYFAETAVGAVVLLSIQFLSLPILAGGLALIGLAKLVSRLRTAGTA